MVIDTSSNNFFDLKHPLPGHVLLEGEEKNQFHFTNIMVLNHLISAAISISLC